MRTYPFKLLLLFPVEGFSSCTSVGGGIVGTEGDLSELCKISLRAGPGISEHGLMVGGGKSEGVIHAILALVQVAIAIQRIAGLAAHEMLDEADLQGNKGEINDS